MLFYKFAITLRNRDSACYGSIVLPPDADWIAAINFDMDIVSPLMPRVRIDPGVQ